MSDTPFEHFGLSCPDGGRFYVCEGSKVEFVGCCTSDPCKDKKGECPQENLRTSSFNTDSYEDLAPQSCDDDREQKIWFTCKYNSPPFMGCCNENACAELGCNRTDLVPAKLSDDPSLRARFLDPSGESPTSTPDSDSDDGGLSSGAIAGIAIGAVVGALIILGLIFWRFFWLPKKRKQSQDQKQDPNQSQSQMQNVQPGVGNVPTPWVHDQSQYSASPQSPYADTYPGTPQYAHQYQSSVSSPDMYPKHSPQMSQFERPLSVSTWSDASAPPYNRHVSQQYNGQQMAPVQELDGAAAVVSELGTGEETQGQKK